MTKLLKFIFTSRYVIYLIIGLSIVTISFGFFFRRTISDFVYDGVQSGLDIAGFTIVAPPVWLGILCFVLAKRKLNLTNMRYLISFMISPIFILGLLGLISTQLQGNYFYGDFQIKTLGGVLGTKIAGVNLGLGIIKVAMLLFVITSIAFPKIVLVIGMWLWKTAFMGFVAVVLFLSGILNKSIRRRKLRGNNYELDEGIELIGKHEVSDKDEGSIRQEIEDETIDANKQILSEIEISQSTNSDKNISQVLQKDFEKRIEYTRELTSDFNSNKPSQGIFDRDFIKRNDSNIKQLQDDVTNEAVEEKDYENIDGFIGEWVLPNINILKETSSTGISEQDIASTSRIIKDTLGEYGIEVEVGQTKPGPTVTMYGLVPGWIRKSRQVKKTDEMGAVVKDDLGKPVFENLENKMRVKVDSIIQREKDLSLALKTPSIRIETPVMGQSLVGIEVPNPSPALVGLRSIMEETEFQKLRSKAKLPIALGKGTGGQSAISDLADMPHLLIAGATGSGKSVCINTIISCLIREKSPEDMRLVMIDPKRVELTPYNGIPHLLAPVVVDPMEVVDLLKSLINEMLDRYKRMESIRARNIETYNYKSTKRMPYIVIIVDELADLMMAASFDVEKSLCRLAQLGRATGIHLILATQRPSVDVLTGLIKANFPSRISFGVASQIDSRTILDVTGAEKLLGKGDMLYLGAEKARPERVQGVYISDKEVEALVDYWTTCEKGEIGQVLLTLPENETENDVGMGNGYSNQDPMMDKAIDLARIHTKLSTSLLQRKLRIGYPRAARLMDDLEENGFVGQSDGSKPRDVII